MQRGRLAKEIYHTDIPLWNEQCKQVLLPLAASLRQQPMDEPTVAQWVVALLMLPNEVFTIPSRTRGGARGGKSRRHRVRHRLSDTGLVSRMVSRMVAPGGVADCQDATATEKQRDVRATMLRMLSPDAVVSAGSGAESDSDASSSAGCSYNNSERRWPRDYITTESDSDSDSESASGDAAETREARSSDASSCDAQAGDARVGGRKRGTAQETKATLCAQQHLSRGYMRRALQSIASVTKLADLHLAAERERLRQLHPSSPAGQAMPRCPQDAPMMVVDVEWMTREMRASDTAQHLDRRAGDSITCPC